VTRHRRNQFDRPVATGFSLVELMIAMTLLALVSVVGLQIMQLSETSFTQGRTQLNIQQKNQAISAFIKDDFKNETLGETSTPIIYRITIANRVAVDVATHREYCQLE
jgi:prepilin-type N-terminal cleavage/methylation domain-containing protein